MCRHCFYWADILTPKSRFKSFMRRILRALRYIGSLRYFFCQWQCSRNDFAPNIAKFSIRKLWIDENSLSFVLLEWHAHFWNLVISLNDKQMFVLTSFVCVDLLVSFCFASTWKSAIIKAASKMEMSVKAKCVLYWKITANNKKSDGFFGNPFA